MNKTSFAAKAKAIGKKMFILLRHIVLHNGWVKLLAMLISLVLWAGLISQDDSLTREKTWQKFINYPRTETVIAALATFRFQFPSVVLEWVDSAVSAATA